MAGFWDFLPTILQVGATLYGVKEASDANTKAANTLAQAQQAGTAAQVTANNNAAAVEAANQAAASPGLIADQAIINRGTALTPAQQQAVTDANTTAINAMNGTGLRGSARAVAATVADTTNRNTATFEQQNQNNVNNAAGQLTGNYFASGNNLANNAVNTGTAISNGLINTGTIAGANDIGQGKLAGQAIGDIGATAANTIKSGIVQNNLGSGPATTNPVTGAPMAAPSSYNKVGDSTTFNNGNTVNWNTA